MRVADDPVDASGGLGGRAAVRPLRILLASDYYPPFIGGVQRQVQLLAHELAGRGHQVEVATVWSPGCPATEDDAGVRVSRMRQLRSAVPALARAGKHHPPPFPDPLMIVALRRLIARFRPDVVHSYGWLSYSCAAALVGRSTPLVLSARDYAYGCPVRTLLSHGSACSGPQLVKCLDCASDYYGRPRGWVAVAGVRASGGLLRRKTSAIHSISTHVRDIVRRDFLDDRSAGIPHEVLPSFGEDGAPADGAVDASIAPLLARLPAEPYILFVGALRPEKGVASLLDAYERLTVRPPLVLVGTLERGSPSFPPGVVVIENLPHAAVMDAWRGALFGVSPSLWAEPLGSVVYEGMRMRRAMIGTIPGGHADMIEDGLTGFLVPAGDAGALAEAMATLIADPRMCRAFGERGELRARRFTASVVVPQIEALYLRVLGSSA